MSLSFSIKVLFELISIENHAFVVNLAHNLIKLYNLRLGYCLTLQTALLADSKLLRSSSDLEKEVEFAGVY